MTAVLCLLFPIEVGLCILAGFRLVEIFREAQQ
jgi:hypothetical protein